jgi:hypothetical protein
MAAEVVLRPGWEADVVRSPEMAAALRQVGEHAAQEAERIGKDVAVSYETRVEPGEGSVRVVASAKGHQGEGLEAAGWIEFGTGGPAPTPAHAPLRKGAEAVGLKSEGTT